MPRLALLPRSCHARPLCGQQQPLPPPSCPRARNFRCFHASARQNEAFPDHYKTLDLPVTASAAEIKKQFYTLSKQHHPDRNRGDPSASSRFVAISAAYHVLGSPAKRSTYDAQLSSRSSPSSSSSSPYASAAYSGPAGSRPASGLSRRRTTFKGPPPSFYRNGAWGAYSAKRASYAPRGDPSGANYDAPQSEDYTGSPYSSDSSSSNGAGAGAAGGGFGPGQAWRGVDTAMPHWDREAHMRTHSEIAARFRARARERGWDASTNDMKNGGGGWSLVANFLAVSAAIGLATGLPAVLVGWR
ncbi:uncharacterized protein J3D65DRAFT_637031 [Phyllosticta citribraziliensis]|uniref:J domain-containing protein n=1 Tax=Phyllosticta citribraziliensis TaxID=989973 RepID=A0ABR1LB81_9PEZI